MMLRPRDSDRCSFTTGIRGPIIRSRWGGSSAGRASRSQCEGREFDPPPLHHSLVPCSSKGVKKIVRPDEVIDSSVPTASFRTFASCVVACLSQAATFLLSQYRVASCGWFYPFWIVLFWFVDRLSHIIGPRLTSRLRRVCESPMT